MEYKIVDGLKKEGKPCIAITIVSVVLLLLKLVYMYVDKKGLQVKEELPILLGYFAFAIIGLYCWLYSIKYQVCIDDKRILLKTLFKKETIDICNIENYFYKRYKKSKFYQFYLTVKGNKVVVITRYKEDFENILIKNKIEKIIK